MIRNKDRVEGNQWIWIEGGFVDGNAINQANTSSPNGGQSGVSFYNSHYVFVEDVFSKNLDGLGACVCARPDDHMAKRVAYGPGREAREALVKLVSAIYDVERDSRRNLGSK